MNWGFIAGLFFILSLCSFVLSKAVIAYLCRHALFDVPNDRSSHDIATPRGGGIAFVAVLLGGFGICGLTGLMASQTALHLIAITLFLTTVSWLDDLRNLGPLIRFGSHTGAVIAALALEIVSGPFFAGLLPSTFELMLIGIGWVWFINLFNFMDGIDGLATSETIAIGLGGTLLVVVTDAEPSLAIACLILVAAALGFLPHNWHPAKVFMGDVGSIPLGFLCAWVLLSLASMGMGPAALILSLVFFTDATLTLFRRLVRREKIWQAHRQHFYQQAVQRGMTHGQATFGACMANICLIGLALWSTQGHEVAAIMTAFLIVAALFVFYLKFPVARPSQDICP